jgi:hypothetical protein
VFFRVYDRGAELNGQKWTSMEKNWRRERDSNPRYPFRHNGFQDRRYQPLTHPSAGENSTGFTSLLQFDRTSPSPGSSKPRLWAHDASGLVPLPAG